jgi:hypothetical protein
MCTQEPQALKRYVLLGSQESSLAKNDKQAAPQAPLNVDTIYIPLWLHKADLSMEWLHVILKAQVTKALDAQHTHC